VHSAGPPDPWAAAQVTVSRWSGAGALTVRFGRRWPSGVLQVAFRGVRCRRRQGASRGIGDAPDAIGSTSKLGVALSVANA